MLGLHAACVGLNGVGPPFFRVPWCAEANRTLSGPVRDDSGPCGMLLEDPWLVGVALR